MGVNVCILKLPIRYASLGTLQSRCCCQAGYFWGLDVDKKFYSNSGGEIGAGLTKIKLLRPQRWAAAVAESVWLCSLSVRSMHKQIAALCIVMGVHGAASRTSKRC